MSGPQPKFIPYTRRGGWPAKGYLVLKKVGGGVCVIFGLVLANDI